MRLCSSVAGRPVCDELLPSCYCSINVDRLQCIYHLLFLCTLMQRIYINYVLFIFIYVCAICVCVNIYIRSYFLSSESKRRKCLCLNDFQRPLNRKSWQCSCFAWCELSLKRPGCLAVTDNCHCWTCNAYIRRDIYEDIVIDDQGPYIMLIEYQKLLNITLRQIIWQTL